ncbi:hypothetical protein RRG08_056499 [Elysia crispata]|uniref:Uncharacterized protein n=1 Tax=Elysia crispata TaxID=231223 RepID=A0AAE0YKX0_9GAST|nr:hypothetical protein RRG08_056499 [Elysia crispata]
MNEIKILLARILHRVTVRLDPDHKVEKCERMVIKAKDDIRLLVSARSFYLAPDDISFFNIITVPFDTEPPPTDDLLDAVSEEISSLVFASRKNSILHIFVCLVTVALEVILEFWKKEDIARSKIWAIRRVR